MSIYSLLVDNVTGQGKIPDGFLMIYSGRCGDTHRLRLQAGL